MKIKKFFALLLAMTLCMGAFSVNAYAYVDESATAESQPVQEEAVPEETPEPEPTEEPMEALTPDGNLTIVDDNGSPTGAGKQFITLVSKNGNYFYLIIDRDDEGEETVHFLNQVDEADLMALTGEEETPATCSCTTKCVAGAVNTSCPVCAVNMTECVGKEAKIEVPAEPTEPAAEEPEKKSGVGGILVVLLIVALGGGAAFYIFKQKKAKPQTKGSADLDDYDYGEDEYEYDG